MVLCPLPGAENFRVCNSGKDKRMQPKRTNVRFWLHLSRHCVILSEQTYVLDGDNMLIQENLSVQEKLKILTDAAKYDVACTSSGVRERRAA